MSSAGDGRAGSDVRGSSGARSHDGVGRVVQSERHRGAGSRPCDGARLGAVAPVDPDALLVALVLVPSSYSRNRFEQLYQWAAVRRVRRRAAMVRSIIGDLCCGVGGQRAELERQRPAVDGGTTLVYRVPTMGLRRTSRLSGPELALVAFAVGRAVAAQRAGGAGWRPATGAEALSADGPLALTQLSPALEGLFRPRSSDT